MAVLLTISETAAGSQFSDSLSGGSTGMDMGQTVNGGYTPISSQSSNTGQQDIYIRHDAVDDPITNVGLYVGIYSGTYGGSDTAANDYATLLAMGAADSGSTQNNNDGNSQGLHIDMRWDATSTNQFSYAGEASGYMRIFGKDYSGLDGSSQGDAFALHVNAMSYWNGSSEVDATTPVTGSIGKSTDTVLGNRGHYKARYYLNSAATAGGVLQWDCAFVYSYTS